MAATGTPTPNIGLRIPLGTDPASVDDINYNSTLLDTKLGAVGNDSVQDQLNDLNSKYKKTHFRVIKTYQSKTVLSEGWVKLDDFETIVNEHSSDIANTWYIGSMNIRGWNGGTMPISIVKGSNGSDFYLLGKGGDTFTSVTVEYFFINPQAVTDAI